MSEVRSLTEHPVWLLYGGTDGSFFYNVRETVGKTGLIVDRLAASESKGQLITIEDFFWYIDVLFKTMDDAVSRAEGASPENLGFLRTTVRYILNERMCGLDVTDPINPLEAVLALPPERQPDSPSGEILRLLADQDAGRLLQRMGIGYTELMKMPCATFRELKAIIVQNNRSDDDDEPTPEE